MHAAVDTLGNLLTLRVAPASAQGREQIDILAERVQEVTGGAVRIAYADQGYTSADPAVDARQHGIELQVVKLPEAKWGFVLLPRRWVVERSFAWTSRFRRLARGCERLAGVLAGFLYIVFAGLMLARAVNLAGTSS